MAELMAFPLNLVDYEYNAKDVMHFLAGRTSGVFGADDNLRVSVVSGMNIKVLSGYGWLSDGGVYGVPFWADTETTLTVSVADGVLPRIDRVVVSWHTPQQVEKPTITIRKGVPASNPVAPVLVNNGEYCEIALAEIRVAAGTTAINPADLKDTRLNEQLCGIVSAGTEKYPTAGLEAEFMAWFDQMKGQLSTDAAGNLQNQLDAHTGNSVIHVTAGDKTTWNGKQNAITNTGIVKCTSAGVTAAAISDVDYASIEQGTFTPRLEGNTTAGAWTAGSENFGRYIKIGKLVFCEMRITGTLTGLNTSENIVFSGLPFTPNATKAGLNGVSSWNNITSAKVLTMANIGVPLKPRFMFNANSNDYLLFSQLQAGGNIIAMSFSYLAD